MVWPIGQTSGDNRAIALRSRERWLMLSKMANIWTNTCGSIHLAHREDEWAVLKEFQEQSSKLGYECSILTSAEVLKKSAAANPERLIGGLFSPTEVGINPRTAIHEIALWLSAHFGVEFQFETTITRLDGTNTISSDGRSQRFDRIIVCGGSDVSTLFPRELAESGLKQCKLQMLGVAAPPNNWRMGPFVASGLTLRHYKNFEVCESLNSLKSRVAKETPELDQFGIHVMASQTDDGSIILGDSHEYDETIEPFDKAVIDELMLRELRSVVWLPDWTITKRWHGIYAKHPQLPIFAAEPIPNVFMRFGPGGAGMTMSFGLAERDWNQWD